MLRRNAATVTASMLPVACASAAAQNKESGAR